MDLDELARAYWAAPPYDEHDHSDGFEKHPFDSLQDLQLDGTDEQLAAMLRALALSAPDEKRLAFVGTMWVESLEYKFDAEGKPGESVRVLVAAGLDPAMLTRVLSGIYPDWLHSMGASGILASTLPPSEIEWLLSDAAPGRRDWL